MSTPHLPTSSELDDLAAALDGASFVEQPLGVRRALEGLVRQATAAQLPAALIAVLADDAQPEVARLRAFGRIAALLDAAPRRPTIAPAA